MGMTHGNANTFPYLAKRDLLRRRRAVVQAAEAVVKLFRDHGNRADRKRARLKYVVHDWGVERFRAVLRQEERAAPSGPKLSARIWPRSLIASPYWSVRPRPGSTTVLRSMTLPSWNSTARPFESPTTSPPALIPAARLSPVAPGFDGSGDVAEVGHRAVVAEEGVELGDPFSLADPATCNRPATSPKALIAAPMLVRPVGDPRSIVLPLESRNACSGPP